MDITVQSEFPGRLRVALRGPVPASDIDALQEVVAACPLVQKVTTYPRTGSLAVTYRCSEGARAQVLNHLRAIDAAAIAVVRDARAVQLAPRTHALLLDIAWLAGSYLARRWFLPRPLSALWILWRYRRYLGPALALLASGRLDVSVLDAAAIGISLARLDTRTAGETMVLLDIGEALEDYTRARSQNELIGSLLALPETAQLVRGNEELAVSASQLVPGDVVAIRTGMPVCVDGVVERGCAAVNQAALTGEPLAVERTVGDDVYAGTVVEDGEIYVRVRAVAADTRVRSIVGLVERSEALKSAAQTRREMLANRIVPWNFLLAGLVALFTRSIEKTAAALMVDYSCALKLTGSIAVLSAMSQSAREGVVVKGSKYFEAMAHADTIVFDKTGTLTSAVPEVEKVIAFDGWNRSQVLRFAACLEERFPHPVARAVVRAAASKNLKHRERHAEVEYVVAHGIASSLEGKRCVIGSGHFVMEDEEVVVSEADQECIRTELADLSPLYLAVDGQLVGAVGVSDPVKPGVPEAISQLRELGFSSIVMLTGDGSRAAEAVARCAGVDAYESNMLPESKHAYVERLKAAGHRVVMVGDGVNDSPALSCADVGIAMGSGTAVAREVADIALTDNDLDAIVRLRRLSMELSARMDRQFRQVMGFNSALLALGIGGAITPQLSSLLHNASTVAFSIESARPYARPGRLLESKVNLEAEDA